ncbi:MAG: hypothetical protein HW407_609 [Bacteroidetes bacterium]|nr:hypothetical protein [Bacteroidota bacterium]
MKSLVCFVALGMTLVINACTPRQTEDQKFEGLAKNYIEKLLEAKPEWATGLGDHRYDSRISDYSIRGIEADRSLNRAYLDSLGSLQVSMLSPVNQIDYKIMTSNLQSWLFQIDTLKEYEWNPLSYNVGGAIYGLTAREFAPLKDRLISVKKRLTLLPSILDAARANLKNPPRIHTETAIRQNPGNIAMMRDALNTYLEQVPELKDEFAPIQKIVISALEAYGTWLEKDLLPRSGIRPHQGGCSCKSRG